MEYNKNGQILREFYARHDLTDCFERDNAYLESAFDEINRIWFDNLCKIDEVNYLMIAEALGGLGGETNIAAADSIISVGLKSSWNSDHFESAEELKWEQILSGIT